MIALILITHYFFDWTFQPRYIAENKSKSLKILSAHVLIYTIGLLLVSGFVCPTAPYAWAIMNGLAHFVVDFFTSKLSAYFYINQNYKAFWNVVGADQLIHYLFLFYSAFALA